MLNEHELRTQIAGALDIITKIQGSILPLGTDPGPIKRMNAWEKRVDERARWISRIVECAKKQHEAHEAFRGMSGDILGHVICEHERCCKATESATRAYLDLCANKMSTSGDSNAAEEKDDD